MVLGKMKKINKEKNGTTVQFALFSISYSLNDQLSNLLHLAYNWKKQHNTMLAVQWEHRCETKIRITDYVYPCMI